MTTIITFLFFFSFFTSIPPPTNALNQEGLYLQHLKHSLDDPTNTLSNWNPRHDTPCNWTGVSCDPNNNSVTSISLSYSNLYGQFPLILCRLHSLTHISLYDNFFNDTLPPEVSECRSLKHLDLGANLFIGQLPHTLPLLPELEYLDLSSNNFSGEVPPSFATFPKLKVISLVENLLDGNFPVMLFNVTTLTTFNVSYNPWTPSSLTSEVGNLVNLEYFWVSNSSLTGELPDSLRRLRKLKNFDIACNQIIGNFPSWLTELTELRQVELYSNRFHGKLPTSGWKRMTSLRNFDASMNHLNGTIPIELARLPLASFNMYTNHLVGKIPEIIAESPNLYELKLYKNKLSGSVPRKLGENSPLILIDVSTNNLSGEIPPNMCSHGALTDVLMMQNSFTGGIPKNLAKCESLQRVRIGQNKLTGVMPDEFWALPRLSLLEILSNSFHGEVPKSIGFALNMTMLSINDNNFTGIIPEEIGRLSKLSGFIAGNNRLTGQLPRSLFELDQLGTLDVNSNELTGEIPPTVKVLKDLFKFNLANNKFNGQIPSEIASISTLSYLDLSNNTFTGNIPKEFTKLRLNLMNLSYNQFSGDLPHFFTKESYRYSFVGNPELCGSISSTCNHEIEAKKLRDLWLLRIIFVLAAVILIVGLVWFYLRCKRFKKVKSTVDKTKWTLMSFHKLGFSEYEILDCLDEDNVIGTGASGKVYKAIVSNGEAVAVKKLWNLKNKVAEGESEGGDVENGGGRCVKDNGFEAEVDTLGKIRHKNIVRLWCCCKTKDCKLLVYEYMPNGSLGDLLHGPKGGLLDWPTRYKIALDSAEGLSYLHHDCVPAIVHRDIKSNNILLDGEFCAKVADFGVAKEVDTIGKGPKSMSVVAGSYGYIAPEYAYTLRVNEKSDTYSFGVVILELVTGKRAVDPEYGEKDLVKWVCTTMDQKGVDHIIDAKLDSCYKEEVCKLLNIGLLCTSPLPINRPSMRRVVKMLQEVSGEDMLKSAKKDGKLTPYYPEEDVSEQGSAVV